MITRLGIAVVALLAAAGSGWTARAVVADRDIAKLHVQAAQERAAAIEASQREQQRRMIELEGAASAATTALRRARADAAAADLAARSLREYADGLAARAGDPAAAPGCQTAADAARVLADLLRSADERAGRLAEIADDRGIAGQACERAYDAVAGAAAPG